MTESKPRKILLVDDNQDILKIMVTKLEAEGYEVFATKDAVSGIIKAKAELPHLIILDVMMPVTDGFEALKRLKSLPETKDIPVIMLTAKRQRQDVLRAIQSGAKDYIVKPIDFNRLLEKIEKNMESGTPDTEQLHILKEAGLDDGELAQLAASEEPPEPPSVVEEEPTTAAVAYTTVEIGKLVLRMRMRRGVMYVEFIGELEEASTEAVIRQLTDVVEFDCGKLALDVSGLQEFHWFKVENFLKIVDWLEKQGAAVRVVCTTRQNYLALIKSKVKLSILREPTEALDILSASDRTNPKA